jgi:hypothetical protein
MSSCSFLRISAVISEVVQLEEEFPAVRIIPVKAAWILPILHHGLLLQNKNRSRASRLVGCVHYLFGGSHPVAF